MSPWTSPSLSLSLLEEVVHQVRVYVGRVRVGTCGGVHVSTMYVRRMCESSCGEGACGEGACEVGACEYHVCEEDV